MTAIEHAAVKLHVVLWNNTGTTRDWPIRIDVDDDVEDELIEAMNGLYQAVKAHDPDLVPWPLKRVETR